MGKINRLYLNLILIIISVISSLILGFGITDKRLMSDWYSKYVYYFLIINIVLYFFSVMKGLFSDSEKSDVEVIFDKFKSFFSQNYLAIIIAVFLTICGSFCCRPDYRILADETNLLSMAQSLYEDKICNNNTSATYYYYNFKTILNSSIDKRPALYPLLVCFMHCLTGYRPENAFVVSIVSGFLSLLLIYFLLKYWFGRFWGICGMVLLAAYPLFVIYSNSAGFEVFNLLFSLLLIHHVIKFLDNPTAINTEILFLFLPLLGQTRYESALAIVCVLPLIFKYLPKIEYEKFSYKLFLLPFLFLPIAWLRTITNDNKSLQVEEVGKAFGWDYLIKNTKQAFEFVFYNNDAYGMIPLISFLALVGLLFMVIEFFFNKKNEKIIYFSCFAFLFYLLHAIARFSYYWGDLTLRFTSRLGIVFLPLFVYSTIYLFNILHVKFNIKRIYSCILIIFLLFIYWPVAGQNMGVRELTLFREFKASRDYLSSNYPNKNEYILVANRSNMYVPFKYNSVNFNYFEEKLNNIKNNLKNRTYNYVIVLQMIDLKTNKPVNGYKTPASVNLETLYETQVRADQFLRISKTKL